MNDSVEDVLVALGLCKGTTHPAPARQEKVFCFFCWGGGGFFANPKGSWIAFESLFALLLGGSNAQAGHGPYFVGVRVLLSRSDSLALL